MKSEMNPYDNESFPKKDVYAVKQYNGLFKLEIDENMLKELESILKTCYGHRISCSKNYKQRGIRKQTKKPFIRINKVNNITETSNEL